MKNCLGILHTLVWGAPALVLILGVGLYLSVTTGFAQITLFPRAVSGFMRKLLGKEERLEDISPFQALCTALAATVGTGNLIGVAGALCLGGPGSIFWMWICGILGMATKFAEVTLAQRWRVRVGQEYHGGPMYMISRGMGETWQPMAKLYCLLGLIASFGVGNATQINAVIAAINGILGIRMEGNALPGNFLMGLALAVLVGCMLMGGAKRIGKTAEALVPLVSGCYILLCLGILLLRIPAIPAAMYAIIKGAFSPAAVTGGVLGSAFSCLQVGCARGVFTNEAGMGTASIAHAAARVRHPAEQGLMGIMEVFLDTILICTLTALAILVSGIPIPYGQDAGGTLTINAFSAVYGDWVGILILLSLCCFAFATVLGWGLYGTRCAQFLFGQGSWKPFVLLQSCAALLGAVTKTETIWLLAETVNGLMAIPNLIALAYLSPELVRLTIEYKRGGKSCRFPSMPTVVNPLPCESSIPMHWKRKKRVKKSII